MQDTEPADAAPPEPAATAPGAAPRPTPRPRPRADGTPEPTAAEPGPEPNSRPPGSTGLLDDIVGRSSPRPAARKPREGGTRSRVLVALGVLVLAGLIAGLVARTYAIPSESMESTLHGCKGCDNDRVLVDRLVYRFGDPGPGEVVVFNAGTDVWKNSEVSTIGETNPIVRGFDALLSAAGIHQSVGTAFVKRVIAVGGQTVSCCDERNRVVIDGKGIDEPYLHYPSAVPARQEPFAPVAVPAGQIFVMGDNRNQSVDSRAKGNGPVPVSSLVGKVRFIVLPLGRMAVVESVDPHTR
jgi:signal peptidase I